MRRLLRPGGASSSCDRHSINIVKGLPPSLREEREASGAIARGLSCSRTRYRLFVGRAMLRSGLNNKWNGGYIACLANLKSLLSDMPEPLIDQRLSILGIYANAILS